MLGWPLRTVAGLTAAKITFSWHLQQLRSMLFTLGDFAESFRQFEPWNRALNTCEHFRWWWLWLKYHSSRMFRDSFVASVRETYSTRELSDVRPARLAVTNDLCWCTFGTGSLWRWSVGGQTLCTSDAQTQLLLLSDRMHCGTIATTFHSIIRGGGSDAGWKRVCTTNLSAEIEKDLVWNSHQLNKLK